MRLRTKGETMQHSISFRIKTGPKQWDAIPLSRFVGSSVEEILLEMDGQESVSELVVETESGRIWKGYLCGNEKWREHYTKKGLPAKTFAEGVAALRAKGSPILGQILEPEILQEIDEVFPGSGVEEEIALF